MTTTISPMRMKRLMRHICVADRAPATRQSPHGCVRHAVLVFCHFSIGAQRLGAGHEAATGALRHRRRTRPRRHGCRLQGLRRVVESLCRDQGTRRFAGRRRGCQGALPARGAQHGRAQRSAHRPDLFHRRRRRPDVFRHGVRRRRIAERNTQARGPAASGSGRAHRLPDRARPRHRARQRRDPSRYQARQHPDRRAAAT